MIPPETGRFHLPLMWNTLKIFLSFDRHTFWSSTVSFSNYKHQINSDMGITDLMSTNWGWPIVAITTWKSTFGNITWCEFLLQILGLFNPSVVITEKFRKCLKLYICNFIYCFTYRYNLYVYKLKYAYIYRIYKYAYIYIAYMYSKGYLY